MVMGGKIGCRWGELESGATTIAFTPMHQHETDDITGHVQTPQSRGDRQPVELCFDYVDIDFAYKVLFEYASLITSTSISNFETADYLI